MRQALRADTLRGVYQRLDALATDLRLNSEQRYLVAVLRDNVAQMIGELEALCAEVCQQRKK